MDVPTLDAQQHRLPSSPFLSGAPARTRRRLRLRTILIPLAALVILAAGAFYGRYWWREGRFLVSTDDAYLAADSVIVSPKVAGIIASVAVVDNQPVHAGQLLARIDDRDFRTARAVAQANVDAETAEIGNLGQQIAQQALLVQEAQATVDADQAALTFSRQDYQRYLDLSRTGAGSVQNAQKATADIQQRQAAVTRDATAVAASRKQIDVLSAQLGKARALLAQQQATLQQAELNLGYTAITASIDGTVGVRTVRVGQYVQAGTQLMAVVPLQSVYVTANFKETQLTDVRPGQAVTIGVDTYPDAVVHGVVDSIAPASGQEFALLPPDNATGNFTKIVQRVPVRITIDPHDALIGRLRPGMSVEPSIDTKAGDTQAGDTRPGDTRKAG